jgi:recombinational DNA repair protein RecR
MADYIESLQRLSEQFGRLPGVGRKSAMRMAFSRLMYWQRVVPVSARNRLFR